MTIQNITGKNVKIHKIVREKFMIITRSPLRISLGGGGTDLPSYYQEHEGFLIAAAINKYVYITLHQTFIEELIRSLVRPTFQQPGIRVNSAAVWSAPFTDAV